MHVPPAICDEHADISDAESVDSCAELRESGSTEDLTSQSREQPQSRGQSQSRDQCISEEVPISVSPRTNKVKESRISENAEDNDRRVQEIPSMGQV